MAKAEVDFEFSFFEVWTSVLRDPRMPPRPSSHIKQHLPSQSLPVPPAKVDPQVFLEELIPDQSPKRCVVLSTEEAIM